MIMDKSNIKISKVYFEDRVDHSKLSNEEALAIYYAD
jgi:hypothetical protein